MAVSHKGAISFGLAAAKLPVSFTAYDILYLECLYGQIYDKNRSRWIEATCI